MLSVVNNLGALNAQRQYNLISGDYSKSVEKLSSGYRVNRAADDAASLTISEKLRSQIRGLTKASENCQDGISYVQVADGALDEVQEMLQRMNELSVKAANGTNTQAERAAINQEISSIKSELSRVFEATEFNTKKIWAPYPEELVFDHMETKTTTDTRPAVIFNSTSITNNVDNNNKGAMPQSNVKITASDEGIIASWKGYNGNTYQSELIPWDEEITGSHSFKLSDHMDYTAYPETVGIDFNFSYTVDRISEKSDVITALNSRTLGVSSNIPVYAVPQYTSSSSPFSFGVSINYDAQLKSSKDFETYDTAFAEGTSMVNPAAPGEDSSKNIEFVFDMPGIGTVRTQVTGASYTGKYSASSPEGYNLWWYGAYRDSANGSIKTAATFEEYNQNHYSKYLYTISHDATPDNASLDGILDSIYDSNGNGDSLYDDNAYHGGTYSINFNLIADTPFEKIGGGTTNSVGTFSMSLNLSAASGATKEQFAESVKNALANLELMDIDDRDNQNRSTFRIYENSGNSSNKVTETTTIETPIYNSIQGEYRTIDIQAGASAADANTIYITYRNLNLDRIGLTDTNTLSVNDSLAAIDEVAKALDIVSEERSKFGAYQNRMEHTIANLDNTVENTTAADSSIRDTDMAKETVNMLKNSLLSQVGTAMMSQSNSSTQNVLQLLQ